MKLPIYQVDAFAGNVFAGNPAAIVPLERWLPDDVLQSIAAENNLAETAYFVRLDNSDTDYELRWFTPTAEVDLCGHATLASAFVISSFMDTVAHEITFATRSGVLTAHKQSKSKFMIDLPALPSQPAGDAATLIDALADVLGPTAVEIHRGTYLLAIYESESDIRDVQYDSRLERVLSQADAWGLIISAPAEPGAHFDFVSRFFAPEKGIPEDPVTGSAHCQLMPYWTQCLGRDELTGRQLSGRGGTVRCRLEGKRVYLSGDCVLYLEGAISI